MFEAFSYLRQYNENKEISDYKDFYRTFSNEKEFGGNTFSHYDHLVKNRFMNFYGHMSNVVLRKYPEKILDIGCGSGVNLPLGNQYKQLEYYGIDYAEKALEHSRSIYPDVNFEVMDAFNLTFKEKTFDMIIISSVLILYKQLEDRLSILKNAQRVMKNDGVLVTVMWNQAPLLKLCIQLSRVIAKLKRIPLPEDFMAIYMTKNEANEMFEKAGFTVKETIFAGAEYGALEATQYITMGKYKRTFGAAEKQFGQQKKQNILEDLQESSSSTITMRILYFFAKYFPSTTSMYSLYILEKK